VSYSEAQPGDIICYYSSASPSGGHCGIYIGNGMMVNAASSKTGIIISSVNPNRSGFVMRRVV
jgi:cell wall-associated NlpC family hydrolase